MHDPDVDIEYLKECLKLSGEERIMQCIEFSEFCAKMNKHHALVLENDHPDIYTLR